MIHPDIGPLVPWRCQSCGRGMMWLRWNILVFLGARCYCGARLWPVEMVL